VIAVRFHGYVRCGVLAMLTAASLTTVVCGVASFFHGIPDRGLWIPDDADRNRVHTAIIDGVIYVVHTSPHRRPAFLPYEAALGDFSVKEAVVGRTLGKGVAFPFWFLALLLGTYPAVSWVRGPLRRSRRRRRGQCIHCCYDLRGNVSGICPECGASIEPGGDRAPSEPSTDPLEAQADESGGLPLRSRS